MSRLFCCRNCIHNCGQTLVLDPGPGFCLQYNLVIAKPDDTTCKYLHRKDLPRFTVDEGIREHAAEFAFFSSMVSLSKKKPVRPVNYSERFNWEKGSFSPIVHALAQYHKMKPHWIMIQAFSGGVDGLRSITHTALIRRYMDRCGTWKSSYRLILALLQEIDVKPHFDGRDIISRNGDPREEIFADALWDVVFARLASLQEYGWHAGIEELTWITDSLNGGLSELDWEKTEKELTRIRVDWTDRLIKHARKEKVFFPPDNQEFESFED